MRCLRWASKRQDGRQPDLTTPRGRHATAALVPGARLMSHARRGRKSAWLRIQARSCLWISEGNKHLHEMVTTRRGEMASSFFIGRWVATTSTRKRRSERRSAWLTCSEPIINHHRSVGGHDFHDFHASGCVPTRFKRRSQRRSAWLTCSGASLKTIKSMLRSRCLCQTFKQELEEQRESERQKRRGQVDARPLLLIGEPERNQ